MPTKDQIINSQLNLESCIINSQGSVWQEWLLAVSPCHKGRVGLSKRFRDLGGIIAYRITNSFQGRLEVFINLLCCEGVFLNLFPIPSHFYTLFKNITLIVLFWIEIDEYLLWFHSFDRGKWQLLTRNVFRNEKISKLSHFEISKIHTITLCTWKI